MNGTRATHVVSVIKANGERYIVLCDEFSLTAAIVLLGKWAVDPELSFNWKDAAVMTERLRAL